MPTPTLAWHGLKNPQIYVPLPLASAIRGFAGVERSFVCVPGEIWICRHFVRTFETPDTRLIHLRIATTFGVNPCDSAAYD